MLYNVKLEERKNGKKWETVSIITNQLLVFDSVCSDLMDKIDNNRKSVKKVIREGKKLVVYYDRKNRAIYNVDYAMVQGKMK